MMLRSFSSAVGGRVASSSSKARVLGRKRALVPPERLRYDGKLFSSHRTALTASGTPAATEHRSGVAAWTLPNLTAATIPHYKPFVILPVSSRRMVQSRQMSTSKGTAGEKEATTAAKETEPLVAAATTTTTTTPITAQLENRIKKVVTDLNLGDQLAVTGILLLLALIVTVPLMVRQMKKSDSTYEEFSTDDPVDDLIMIHQRGGAGEEGKFPFESLLQDVLQSKALQQAAQQFVIRIMESTEFKAALNRLIKELWTELIEDPETLQQIVKLLQVAIQDPAIRKAAQKLVTDLVAEPDVKEALIETIQRLGGDEVVQNATRALLTESAHNALNDSEILDHSMEFATDVLGDDIVQRTAGEALRNTVGHAVRPASTVVLTATGVGLLIFGIVAIGYAKSSDQEARLFETAARSLQTNATYGVLQILSFPGRTVRWLVNACGYILSYPFVALKSSLAQLGEAVSSRAQRGSQHVVESVAKWFVAATHALSDRLGRSRRYLSDGMAGISATVLGNMTQHMKHAYSATAAATASLLVGIQHAFFRGVATSQQAGKSGADSLSKLGNRVVESVIEVSAALQAWWFGLLV